MLPDIVSLSIRCILATVTTNRSDVGAFSEYPSSDFAVSYGSATNNFSASFNSVFHTSASFHGEIPSICFFSNESSLLQIIISRVTRFPNLSKTFDNIFPLRDFNLIKFSTFKNLVINGEILEYIFTSDSLLPFPSRFLLKIE